MLKPVDVLFHTKKKKKKRTETNDVTACRLIGDGSASYKNHMQGDPNVESPTVSIRDSTNPAGFFFFFSLNLGRHGAGFVLTKNLVKKEIINNKKEKTTEKGPNTAAAPCLNAYYHWNQ